MKHEDTRVQYTRSALKHAMASLLRRKTVADITVKELCAEAGINRGTFYLHYSCPEDVLQEMQHDFLELNSETFRQMMSSTEAATSPDLAISIMDCISRDKELTQAVFSPNGNPYFIENIRQMARGQTLAEWKREYPDASPENLDFIYEFVFEGSMRLIRKWISKEENCTGSCLASRLELLGRNCLRALDEFQQT